MSQIAIAVPTLLVLARHVPGNRSIFAAALLLLAIPWLELAENPLATELVAVSAVTAFVMIFVVRARHVLIAAVIAATATLVGAEHFIRTTFPPTIRDVRAQLALAADGSNLADATWAIHAHSIDSTAWFVASHVPTWIGLTLLIASAAVAAAATRTERASSAPAATTRQGRATSDTMAPSDVYGAQRTRSLG